MVESASTLLLDGAMGTELRARGVEVPDHITSIWSAKALLDDPEAVVGVHRDYIEAGADVITINNYMLTPTLLAREGLGDRLEELILLAFELAARARDAAGRSVRIAGSLPPLATSYRPDEVGEDAAIRADYERIATVLAGRVDLMLCETLSSAREARAAALAATATGTETWLSWTLQGDRLGRLPSQETVETAHEIVADLPIDAFLVNCCGANLVSDALPRLSKRTDRRIGGYANAAEIQTVDETGPRPTPETPPRSYLDPEAYSETVAGWLDAGASIVGGCCGTRPAHIAALRALLDARA